jgi:hypothetical protein
LVPGKQEHAVETRSDLIIPLSDASTGIERVGGKGAALARLAAAGILWRVPKEEQMMVEAFGDEYKAYMRRNGRFFPKLEKGVRQ